MSTTIIDKQSAKVFTVDLGGDMSAARRSACYLVGAGKASVQFSWPVTGTPRGAFAVEFGNDSSLDEGAVHPACLGAEFVAAKPAGFAGGVLLDNMEHSTVYMWITYTPTSGGTGATATITVGK